MTSDTKKTIQTSTLAEIYFNQGFYQKARRVYEGILEQDPGNIDVQARIEQIDRLLVADGPSDQPAAAASTHPLIDRFERWLAAIERRRSHV